MLMKSVLHWVPALLLTIIVAACSDRNENSVQEVVAAMPDLASVETGGRWYSQAQADRGRQVFTNNCAECHGANAEGTVANWQRRLDDGSLPPPPLNGSAHAWHHPLVVLLQVVNEGGIPLGGSMPAFGSVLEEADKLAAIAYFQSFWDDETYGQWGQMGGIN